MQSPPRAHPHLATAPVADPELGSGRRVHPARVGMVAGAHASLAVPAGGATDAPSAELRMRDLRDRGLLTLDLDLDGVGQLRVRPAAGVAACGTGKSRIGETLGGAVLTSTRASRTAPVGDGASTIGWKSAWLGVRTSGVGRAVAMVEIHRLEKMQRRTRAAAIRRIRRRRRRRLSRRGAPLQVGTWSGDGRRARGFSGLRRRPLDHLAAGVTTPNAASGGRLHHDGRGRTSEIAVMAADALRRRPH